MHAELLVLWVLCSWLHSCGTRSGGCPNQLGTCHRERLLVLLGTSTTEIYPSRDYHGANGGGYVKIVCGRPRMSSGFLGVFHELMFSAPRPLDWMGSGRARSELSACETSRGRVMKLRFSWTPWNMSTSMIFMVLIEAENVKTTMISR